MSHPITATAHLSTGACVRVIAMDEHSALNEQLRGIAHNAEALRNTGLSTPDLPGIAFLFHAVFIASIFAFR